MARLYNMTITTLYRKLIGHALLILIGVFIGAFLFNGCGQPDAIPVKPTIKTEIKYIPGDTIVKWIESDPKVIIREVATTPTIVIKDDVELNQYTEEIIDSTLTGTLTILTSGTLEEWQLDYTVTEKTIQITDTVFQSTTITKPTPRRNILLVGGGLGLGEGSLREISLGAGISTKTDRVFIYKYNLGLDGLGPYHSLSLFLPIKPGAKWRERRNNP
jgi:hypothetical protein